jgi:hypothetical protein
MWGIVFQLVATKNSISEVYIERPIHGMSQLQSLRVLHVELLADTLKLLDLVVSKKEVPSLQNVASTH